MYIFRLLVLKTKRLNKQNINMLPSTLLIPFTLQSSMITLKIDHLL